METIHELLGEKLGDQITEHVSAQVAQEAVARRRAKYWLNGLAIKQRATKLREYLGRINDDDGEFLRRDPHIVETVEELRRLSWEANNLAGRLKAECRGVGA
jgi:hypothetical protein